MATSGLQELFDELKAVVLEADAVVGRAGDAVAPASDAAGPAPADGAHGAVDKLRTSAVRAADSTVDFIREHPWQALGVAAVTGFVVGWLAKRK